MAPNCGSNITGLASNTVQGFFVMNIITFIFLLLCLVPFRVQLVTDCDKLRKLHTLKFFTSVFMKIHCIWESIIGLYWVARLCRQLYAPMQKSTRNNQELNQRPIQMAPLMDEYTTGSQIRPTLVLHGNSPLLAPLMTEESTPKAVFQPPKLPKPTENKASDSETPDSQVTLLLGTTPRENRQLQHKVVNDYYEKCPMEVMSRLEQQTAEILDVMYDSVTNQNFDRVSDDVDGISGAVDNDSDKIDTDYIQMPYDNDNSTGQMKSERNMTKELKDVGTNDMVSYERNDNKMTKVKWSIETNDVDNDFKREYDKMCKSMEDRQINDFYEARRHIQSTMMGDTPVKTVQNRRYIDNVSDYDSEHHRISKSVCHRLDLGPISILGAQQHTTVESAAALKRQDKIEGKFKAHIQSDNG